VADVRPAAAFHVRARPWVSRAQGTAQRIAWALTAELAAGLPQAADDVRVMRPCGLGLHVPLQVALVARGVTTILRESPALTLDVRVAD
jgi:hypothetical protein